MTNSNGYLIYEGEITQYRISPMTATADQTAAQNRLYISIMVRFTNKRNPDDDFEKSFSHFYDYPANEQLIRSEEHTSELQSRPHLVCRLLLEKKKKKENILT